MNRRWSLVVVGVAAAVIGFAALGPKPPTFVVTTSVHRRDAKVVLALTGQIEPITDTTVSSQISFAQVKGLRVDLGDRVKAGQVLLDLDTASLDAQKRQSMANLQSALSSLAKAKATRIGAHRAANLAQETLASALDLKASRDQAAETVRVQRAKVKVAEIQLEKTGNGGRAEAVNRSQSILASAEATLADKQRNYNRYKTLFEEKAVAKSDVDDAQLALTKAEQDVISAREDLRQVRLPRSEDVAEATASLEQERANLRSAESNLANLETNYRTRFSLKSSAITAETEALSADAAIQGAEAEVTRCQAAIAQIDVQLRQSRIVSPIDGVISRRSVNVGQTIQTGSILFRITGDQAFRAVADVDEKYVWQLDLGQPAIVHPEAFPGLKVAAVVDEISQEANSDRGTVKVRFGLKKSDPRLRADLSMDINVVTATVRSGIVVPDSCLLRETNAVSVLVIREGKAVKVPVELGQQADSGTLVLDEGDVVVNDPRSVTVGQVVRSKDTKP